VACVEAIALYGSEIWWDPREIDWRDDLQLLLNREARSMLGALPTTQRGALMRESGLTPAPVILDSRQQRFAARIENTCSSRPKEQHKNSSSGAPICRAVRKDHEHGRTTRAMNWPAPGEEPEVRTAILDDTTAAKGRAALGKSERSQSRRRGLDVVHSWIALRQWPSGRHSSV